MVEVRQNWKCRQEGEKWDSLGLQAWWSSLGWIKGRKVPEEWGILSQTAPLILPSVRTTCQTAGIAFFIPEFDFVGGFCQVCQESTPSGWGKSPLPEMKRHDALSPIADPRLSVPFQFQDLGKHNIILYLYGSNGSWVALQHSHRGAGSKTPDSHDFVAAARGQQRVLVVHGHVGNLSRVSSQRGEQAPVICSPDFDQTIIWPLMPHKNFHRLSERTRVMCAKYTGTAQMNVCQKHPRAMNLPEEQPQWDSTVSDFGDHLWGQGFTYL